MPCWGAVWYRIFDMENRPANSPEHSTKAERHSLAGGAAARGPALKSGGKRKTVMIPAVKAKLLEGKKGLVVGIANENSIAWGCAKAFRAFGAEGAVTYFNDKAQKYVEPTPRELASPL